MKEIEKIEKQIIQKYKRLDETLYKIVMDYLSDNLSIKDDTIKSTLSNVGVINAIQKKFNEKATPILKNIKDFIVKSIKTIIIKGAEDMAEYSPEAVASGREIAELMARQAVKTITANLTLEKTFAEIKGNIIGMMSRPGGIALKDLRKTLESKIIEKGITRTQFLSWTMNVFMQYQRAGSNDVRKKLKLKYAIYQGGIMNNTRDFCLERNGKVYSEKEIETWTDVDFPEKWDPYNPFTDCGCYNCRHRLDWISDELAEKMRPELKGK